jgi:hypothetical protein
MMFLRLIAGVVHCNADKDQPRHVPMATILVDYLAHRHLHGFVGSYGVTPLERRTPDEVEDFLVAFALVVRPRIHLLAPGATGILPVSTGYTAASAVSAPNLSRHNCRESSPISIAHKFSSARCPRRPRAEAFPIGKELRHYLFQEQECRTWRRYRWADRRGPPWSGASVKTIII